MIIWPSFRFPITAECCSKHRPCRRFVLLSEGPGETAATWFNIAGMAALGARAGFLTGCPLHARAPPQTRIMAPLTIEAAHKKGAGSTKNGRDSNSKRRGVKVYGGQPVKAGGIIVRQLGTHVSPPLGTALTPVTALHCASSHRFRHAPSRREAALCSSIPARVSGLGTITRCTLGSPALSSSSRRST